MWDATRKFDTPAVAGGRRSRGPAWVLGLAAAVLMVSLALVPTASADTTTPTATLTLNYVVDRNCFYDPPDAPNGAVQLNVTITNANPKAAYEAFKPDGTSVNNGDSALFSDDGKSTTITGELSVLSPTNVPYTDTIKVGEVAADNSAGPFTNTVTFNAPDCNGNYTTPTPTATSSPSPSPTATPTDTATPTPVPTVTSTPSSQPTVSPTMTTTPSPTATPTPNQAPVARFSISTTQLLTGQRLGINVGNSTDDQGLSGLTFYVDWGSGSFVELTSLTATQRYDRPGRFLLRVEAVDAAGKSSVATQVITVLARTPATPSGASLGSAATALHNAGIRAGRSLHVTPPPGYRVVFDYYVLNTARGLPRLRPGHGVLYGHAVSMVGKYVR